MHHAGRRTEAVGRLKGMLDARPRGRGPAPCAETACPETPAGHRRGEDEAGGRNRFRGPGPGRGRVLARGQPGSGKGRAAALRIGRSAAWLLLGCALPMMTPLEMGPAGRQAGGGGQGGGSRGGAGAPERSLGQGGRPDASGGVRWGWGPDAMRHSRARSGRALDHRSGGGPAGARSLPKDTSPSRRGASRRPERRIGARKTETGCAGCGPRLDGTGRRCSARGAQWRCPALRCSGAELGCC